MCCLRGSHWVACKCNTKLIGIFVRLAFLFIQIVMKLLNLNAYAILDWRCARPDRTIHSNWEFTRNDDSQWRNTWLTITKTHARKWKPHSLSIGTVRVVSKCYCCHIWSKQKTTQNKIEKKKMCIQLRGTLDPHSIPTRTRTLAWKTLFLYSIEAAQALAHTHRTQLQLFLSSRRTACLRSVGCRANQFHDNANANTLQLWKYRFMG